MKVCPPRSVECLGTFVLKDLVRLVHSDDCSSRGCDYIHIHICVCMCVHPRGNCQMCKGVHLPSNTHACMYVRAYAKTHEGRTQDSLKTSKASAFFLLSLVFAANKSHLPWTCRETQTNTRQEVPLGLDMLRDTDTHTHKHTHTHTANKHAQITPVVPLSVVASNRTDSPVLRHGKATCDGQVFRNVARLPNVTANDVDSGLHLFETHMRTTGCPSRDVFLQLP